MPFCPFFNTNCPESNEGDSGCAIWTDFGCCIIDKPGIPAVYSGGAEPIDVFILGIFSANAKADGDILIVYANNETGAISTSDTLSDFAIHLLH